MMASSPEELCVKLCMFVVLIPQSVAQSIITCSNNMASSVNLLSRLKPDGMRDHEGNSLLFERTAGLRDGSLFSHSSATLLPTCWHWWICFSHPFSLLSLSRSPFICTSVPLSSIVKNLPYALLCQSRWNTTGRAAPRFALASIIHVTTGYAWQEREGGQEVLSESYDQVV